VELEKQENKMEKLKVTYRDLIKSINLSVMLYNNSSEAEQLETSKKLVEAGKTAPTKPYTW
jgi:hypothetical protein